MVPSGLEECCVWDPQRISLLDVIGRRPNRRPEDEVVMLALKTGWIAIKIEGCILLLVFLFIIRRKIIAMFWWCLFLTFKIGALLSALFLAFKVTQRSFKQIRRSWAHTSKLKCAVQTINVLFRVVVKCQTFNPY